MSFPDCCHQRGSAGVIIVAALPAIALVEYCRKWVDIRPLIAFIVVVLLAAIVVGQLATHSRKD